MENLRKKAVHEEKIGCPVLRQVAWNADEIMDQSKSRPGGDGFRRTT